MKWVIACTLLLFVSCKRFLDASVPNLSWSYFDSSAAKDLTGDVRSKLEGIYKISGQEDDFGDDAALKWSYNITHEDTTFFLSVFCKEDVRYFILRGKTIDSSIILNGYWRNVENTKTGKAHLIITAENGGTRILFDPAFKKEDGIRVTGYIGMFDDEPLKDFSLQYLRPLYEEKPLAVIAHRGGGRNSDLLPASENSVNLITQASLFGANGIEIDVKLTKDGVPVLYHDANINDRLTNVTGVHPPIQDYSFAELQKDIRLKDGEMIPTLREALETVLYRTPLEFVWLDSKDKNVVPQLKQYQNEFMKKAGEINRKLTIAIGIPDDGVYEEFKKLPEFQQSPSVCELSDKEAIAINANVWAQSWVKGLQNEEVTAMQQKQKRVFVWTIDAPRVIRYFLKKGQFDGYVTNRPSMIAYYHYANLKERDE